MYDQSSPSRYTLSEVRKLVARTIGVNGLLSILLLVLAYFIWSESWLFAIVLILISFGFLVFTVAPGAIDLLFLRPSVSKGRLWKEKSNRTQNTRYFLRYGQTRLKSSKKDWLSIVHGNAYQFRYGRNTRFIVSSEALALPRNGSEQKAIEAPDSGESIAALNELETEWLNTEIRGQCRAILGTALLTRGRLTVFVTAFALMSILIGNVGITLTLVAAALILFSLQVLPTVIDLCLKHIDVRGGRISKERLWLNRGPYLYRVDVAEVELECTSMAWSVIEDDAFYEVFYTRRSKWLVTARKRILSVHGQGAENS